MGIFPIQRETNHFVNDLTGFVGDRSDLDGLLAQTRVRSRNDFTHGYYYSTLEERWGVELDLELAEGEKSLTEGFAGGGFNDNLPGVTASGAFVESGHRWG